MPCACCNFGFVQNDFFHTNLRNARLRAGITQTELAESLDIARTTIVSLENGNTKLFSKHIPAIARCYGISVEELLCGEDVETLIRQQSTWEKRQEALKAEYEGRLATLTAERDQARRELARREESLKTLETTNHFLLEQLRKG